MKKPKKYVVARALQDAGAFAVVIEKVPAELAQELLSMLTLPMIGIGAGCDGQILVSHDMLGIYTRFRPRFVRRYAVNGETMRDAFSHFVGDGRSGEFPNESESY
ncbi:MAG: 3-methyl-2-oxobutanoate hydroxymethyltransferase [Planctomycetota bacterium]|jgi:3-methyl-2-oxobutanoate hydroxymethyltransferase